MRKPELGALETIGWLADQPESLRTLIAELGRWKRFAPGQPIFEVGEPADAMYGVGEGVVATALPVRADSETVIHHGGPGFWFGDNALILNSQRVTGTRAVRAAKLFAVPARDVRALLAREPVYWEALFELRQRNLQIVLQALAETLALSPQARITRRLLDLADGDGVAHVTRAELASLVGATRTTVHRALATLIEDGLVATGYRTIRILDRDGLTRSAGEDGIPPAAPGP